MKLLEQYFLARVDRALDDGTPLTGLTRWFVKRNDRLRSYYESMLALEMELRFSNAMLTGFPMTASRPASPFPHRKFLGIGATVAVCLLVVVGLVFHRTPEPLPTNLPNDALPEVLTTVVSLEGIDESLIDFSERPLELTASFLAQVGSLIATHSP
jgi:hypothetical protein